MYPSFEAKERKVSTVVSSGSLRALEDMRRKMTEAKERVYKSAQSQQIALEKN